MKELLPFGIAIVIVSVLFFTVEHIQEGVTEEYKQAIKDGNIYCPKSTKFVKGDGLFTQDHYKPLAKEKTDIVRLSGYYLYSEDGTQYNRSDCNVGR